MITRKFIGKFLKAFYNENPQAVALSCGLIIIVIVGLLGAYCPIVLAVLFGSGGIVLLGILFCALIRGAGRAWKKTREEERRNDAELRERSSSDKRQ